MSFEFCRGLAAPMVFVLSIELAGFAVPIAAVTEGCTDRENTSIDAAQQRALDMLDTTDNAINPIPPATFAPKVLFWMQKYFNDNGPDTTRALVEQYKRISEKLSDPDLVIVCEPPASYTGPASGLIDPCSGDPAYSRPYYDDSAIHVCPDAFTRTRLEDRSSPTDRLALTFIHEAAHLAGASSDVTNPPDTAGSLDSAWILENFVDQLIRLPDDQRRPITPARPTIDADATIDVDRALIKNATCSHGGAHVILDIPGELPTLHLGISDAVFHGDGTYPVSSDAYVHVTDGFGFSDAHTFASELDEMEDPGQVEIFDGGSRGHVRAVLTSTSKSVMAVNFDWECGE
jgi:hypothetical protein